MREWSSILNCYNICNKKDMIFANLTILFSMDSPTDFISIRYRGFAAAFLETISEFSSCGAALDAAFGRLTAYRITLASPLPAFSSPMPYRPPSGSPP